MGVCGAEYLGGPYFLRLVWFVLIFAQVASFLIYLALGIILQVIYICCEWPTSRSSRRECERADRYRQQANWARGT